MAGRATPFTRRAASLFGVLVLAMVPSLVAADPPKKAEPKDKVRPLEMVVFERLLAQHQDMTYEQLHARLYKDRDYLQKLSFDPVKVAYFAQVVQKLELTKQEQEVFHKQGFVSIDQNRRHTFASAYYQIYAQDLPVLVTSDSIMHALHRSYDDILLQLETTLFTYTIKQVLEDCNQALAERAAKNQDKSLTDNYKDVDLYLTIAQNLLAGAGAPKEAEPSARDRGGPDVWSGDLLVPSRLDNDKEALARLKDVQSLKIQIPFLDEPTRIYGGERFMDYSQFKPRGHYTKSIGLRRYFCTLMWLGRVDCGWNVLPPDPTSGVKSDSKRELRNAVLLVELLGGTDGLKPLKAVDDIIAFLVGRSDNLTVFALADIMKQNQTPTLTDLATSEALKRLQTAIENGKQAQQMIRSQVVISDPRDPYHKVKPPAVFQLFGQRYILDSFVLSQVVFDSIIFEKKKQRRMMPSGLDVMAALGNAEAVPLLAEDLRKWNYSANLMASREVVDLHTPEFWKANLYNLWLDCLRALQEDMTQHKRFPEAMRTQPWQRKQLQTQLGSWAELRHDTILYAKQSYTAFPKCSYPAGYVEPYPQFYTRVKYFAEEAGRLFQKADYTIKNKERAAELEQIKARQILFFKKMAATLGTLETLAKKELKAEAFTDQEKTFLKKTVDIRGGGSGPPRYDGWYCDLFYNRTACRDWEPTIADVHTDPESRSCLEVGVGDANFGIIAINNESDRAVYVGPLFSYYEFRHPVGDRLTDEQWQQRISTGKAPARPQWTEIFQAPARK